MMVAAGKEVSEFVGEQNGKERERKGKSSGEGRWMAVNEGEVVEEFVHGGGAVVGERDSEVCSGNEASGESKEEKKNGESERFVGRPMRDGFV